MRRICRFALILGFSSLLAACQTGLASKGVGGDDVTPNAVLGDPIEVTALDALPGEAASEASAADPAAKPDAPPTAAPQAAPPAPAEGSAAAAPVEPAPASAPKADLAASPATPKSERELACERKGGDWSKVGKGTLRACVLQTRDGGKSCTKESDCDGVCLARSRTCSPLKPLYGCNDILQDNGARVTLCID